MHTLLDIFDGRRDAFFNSEKVALEWVDEFEWLNAFACHAIADRDIGVYPRRDDGTCKWGCVDIDSGDFSEALSVYGGLKDAGLRPWIEASKSKGFHVWVFAADWIDAPLMRSILVEVVRHAGLPEKTEINPKQTTSTDKHVGNCVRLPYGKWALDHSGRCCMVLTPDGESGRFSMTDFLARVEPDSVDLLTALGNVAIRRSTMRKATEEAIRKLRQHETWQPPYGANSPEKGGRNQRSWRILNGLERAADGERNDCAFAMARHLHGLGISHNEALAKMTMAVQRSFDDGHNFVGEATAIVDRVYGTGAW
jgi:hypothetical protein